MADVAEERGQRDGEAPATGSGPPGSVYLTTCSFNQNFTCFVCGTTAGFRVYTVSPVCEVHRREHTAAFQHGSVVLVAMLFKTNIFAMVTVFEDDPARGGLNKVQLWDDLKGKFVGELRSRNEVKGVALRRDIIAMVCEYAIYVYTFDKLRVILHLTTSANPKGLCALAAAGSPWVLCCPGQSVGAVRVQVGQDDRATHVFAAHQTALAALALNESGSILATASETGTVVKVFQRSDGQLLYRLRRSARPAAVSCLAFRPDDRFLAVASSSSTVHIFKLDLATALPAEEPPPPEPADAPANPSIEQMLHRAVTKVASRAAAETVSDVVKGVMPQYFNDLRGFARFRIPDIDSSGQAKVDARSKQSRILGPQLAFHKEEPTLFVLHYSGVLYECRFKPDHDPSLGTQDCGLSCATTFFAVRPDFRVQGPGAQVATVAGGAAEDDEEAEEWQLL